MPVASRKDLLEDMPNLVLVKKPISQIVKLNLPSVDIDLQHANAGACKLKGARQPYITKTDNYDCHLSIVHLREPNHLLWIRWFRREEQQPGI